MLATTKATSLFQADAHIRLPRLHPSQVGIKRKMGRYNVVDAGRRWGKDILGQDRAVQTSLGQQMPVAWLAPTYRMLAENYRMLSNTLSSVTMRKLNNERVDLLTGGFIDFWSLEQPDRVRGHRYKRIIVNEAAMVNDLLDVWNLIIRPTLIDLRGEADFYSTPRGLNGFHSLWRQGEDVEGWQRFQVSSYENPHIPEEELRELEKHLPERVYKQEILAEFLQDGSYFQGVEGAADVVEREEPGEHKDHYLVMGVDWALVEDFTVITVACRECNRVVDWERFNRIDYTYQREKVISAARRWSVAGVLPERNSIGQPNIELLVAGGVPIIMGLDGQLGFTTTATSKPQLIQSLASALEHERFRVPADYADELRSYQVELSTGGRAKFDAPSGQHDDRVISLALAWWALANGQWYMS